MNEFKMFVITHKKIEIKLPCDYIPIQVGKCNTNIILPYISDDSGDNISTKNSNYCELTAIYWLWKNYDLPKYVGICHYRRYLVKGFFSRYLKKNDIINDMKNYDVILPEVFHTKSNVYNYYIKGSGVKKDIDNLRDIINNNYSDYLKDFDSIIESECISYCNIAIMKRKDFINYCSWLFDVLFNLEKITDLTNYSIQEQRIYGYLAELLLNVWIKHQNLKVKNYSVLYPKKNIFVNFLARLKLGIKIK